MFNEQDREIGMTLRQEVEYASLKFRQIGELLNVANEKLGFQSAIDFLVDSLQERSDALDKIALRIPVN
jgi:hypothetical protein